MQVSVLGAGVAGLCVATALAERGAEVTVIDPAPHGASWLAGGMLAPFCEGELAPPEVVRRGQGALAWWRARVPDVVQNGTLVVAPVRDGAELARFARATTGHVAAEPSALEPDLAGRFARGLFFAQEGHLDPRAALAALVARLRGMGVTLAFGVDTCPRGQIVDCRGLAAREALRALPALRAVRGEMLLLATEEIRLHRPVRLLHPRFPCYIVPRGRGLFMVGATMLETDHDGPITARSMAELLGAAAAVHPAFAEAGVVETGAGLRPALPDNLPRVLCQGDHIHVNGLYRHGFLLAPSLAEEVVAMLYSEGQDA